MLRVGLTGGIGSGKSTVARIFQVLGIPVLFADDLSKRIMNEDAELKAALIASFGSQVYTDGKLNRSYLAETVFSDSKKLALLNSLVHPATIREAALWMQRQSAPYAIKEAALIFESGSQKGLDFVIGVFTPVELRIERVMKRDHLSREQVLSRMQKQMNEDEKMSLCDFVITNDEKSLLIPQVLELNSNFLDKIPEQG